MSSRRQFWIPALIASVLLAAGCIPPPDGGGAVPACPARSVSTLAGAGSSLVRGISSDGTWIVTSNLAGPDAVLVLRRADNAVPAVEVATLAGLDSSDDEFSRLSVGVSDDGELVVVDGSRWSRATGALQPLVAPVAGATVLRQSPDRTRTAWAVPGDDELVVTDSFTDAVLGWSDVAQWGTSGSGRYRLSAPSPSVASLVDLADGTAIDLSAAWDAIDAADPGAVWHGVDAAAVSPDGTVVALETLRNNGGFDPARRLWVWDTDTASLRDLGWNRGRVQAADDGTVAFATTATLIPSIRASLPDGSFRTIYSGTNVVEIGGGFDGSEDLRTVALSASTTPLGPSTAVYLSRCS
jgi:diadenosine tetraphosphatase ApaH/serine/threonine PP2A family protein phosphatase